MKSASEWNACRLVTGGLPSKAGHVESYFLKLNAPDDRRALWLKATLRAPADGSSPVAESWAIAFERGRPPRAVKRVIPYAQARFSGTDLDLEVAGLAWTFGHIQGEVASGKSEAAAGASGMGGRVAFDLRMTDAAPPLAPLPTARMYTGGFPSSKFVSPAPDASFDGHYEVDGERVDVSGWRGMQGHNWGRRHAHRYAWGHCNRWAHHDDLVFEGVTAQVKLGPILAPPLTLLCVFQGGVRYLFNSGRDLLRARGSFDFRRWSFHAENDLARVEGELWADAPDFAGLRYDNPVGPPTHCLNSKIANGRLVFTVRGRAPLTATTRGAALEIGTHDTGHGIPLIA